MAALILFKYTSRSRPIFFFRGLDSIVNNLANKEDYHILCTFDVDDREYSNPAFIERLKTYKNVSFYFGISHNKINAINRDMAFAPPFKILVNFSDDQIFLLYGFDNIIRADMEAVSDDYDAFIHYPDTHAKDRLPTMSIMGVKYYQRTGHIYHPAFMNVYSDNWAMSEARHLGKYHFFDKPIFDHLHPAWGTAPMDDQYRKTEAPEGYEQDRKTYYELMKTLK